MEKRTIAAMRLPVATLLLLVAVSPPTAFGDDAQGRPAAIRIAVYRDVGVGRSVGNLLSVLEGADGLHVEKVAAEEVRNGVLGGFAVLIHPGGSGSKQGKQLGEEGREAVRSFVRGGGGFIGICAGAYLASADYPWSLHILDAKVLDRKHWARGNGTVRVGLTDQGRAILDTDSPDVNIYYGQGPLLAPAGDADIPDYIALGAYETEIAKNGAPSGVMIGTTAIAAGTFGCGKVLCFSPHPEKTEGLGAFVHRAIEYVVGVSTIMARSSEPSG
jgi:hypothetical protein